MRLGAHDYLSKPIDLGTLRLQVRNAFEHYRLKQENRRLRERLAVAGEIPEMIGQSAAIREVFAQIRQVADTDVTILIQGESGTGKELVAKAIHNLSPRRDGPFVAANFGALPEGLIESELFGYEKGAFTGAQRQKAGWFEMARGGTLLLDEVGEMVSKTQIDLLRVLETARSPPAGRRRHGPAGRPARGGHAPGRRRPGRQRQDARGPVLPPERDPAPRPSPPRAARRHPAAGPALHPLGPVSATAASRSRSPAPPCEPSASTPGRETSAS